MFVKIRLCYPSTAIILSKYFVKLRSDLPFGSTKTKILSVPED